MLRLGVHERVWWGLASVRSACWLVFQYLFIRGGKHVPGANRGARPRSALVPACRSRASETLRAHNPPMGRGAYHSEGCALCLEEPAGAVAISGQ